MTQNTSTQQSTAKQTYTPRVPRNLIKYVTGIALAMGMGAAFTDEAHAAASHGNMLMPPIETAIYPSPSELNTWETSAPAVTDPWIKPIDISEEVTVPWMKTAALPDLEGEKSDFILVIVIL